MNIKQQLEHYEAKVAVRDDLIDVLEQAFNLIPVGQLQQGYTWIPSAEAIVILSLAKNRLREHSEMKRIIDES